MTPESRNSPLLDNGLITHVFMGMRILEDRLSTESVLHANGIKKMFPWIRTSNKHFSMESGDDRRGCADIEQIYSRVRAGSNTSTVAPQVVEGDKK
jgi:hypothetical protein